MDRNEYEETKLAKVTASIIGKFKCFQETSERWLIVRYLRDLCHNYKTSSSIFKILVKGLAEGSCDLNFVDAFIDVCVPILSRWVTPDGRTDTVGLFLEFSNSVKDIMAEKGFRSRREFEPDRHPVNQNLFRGRTVNIPLLLRHGLRLEFTESFYELLQWMVVREMVASQRPAFLEKVRQLPNQKRVFLVLLVIFTFKKAEKMPLASSISDPTRALRTIWKSIPDPHLCRREITKIFEGIKVYSKRFQTVIEQYEKFVCEDDFGELGQPRSLAHHSRCRVRQVLQLRGELPTGVDALPLPMKIKNYLLLE